MQYRVLIYCGVGNGCVSKQTEVERQESIGMKSYSSSTMTPKNVNELRQSPGYSNVDMFTYEEMRLATKSFRPDFILGEGGFGIVHKGVIEESVRPGYPTTQVAIKELNHEGLQGDREWLVFVLLFLLIMFSFSLLNRLCFL